MTEPQPSVDASRAEILARLAQSRSEILQVLEPPPEETAGGASGGHSGLLGGFAPRSRTMKMLMSKRGLGTVGALVGGLIVARPALAWRLLRLLPTGAAARVLLVRAIGSMRSGGKRS